MKTDSLKKRYFAKLFANLVGMGIVLVTQTIIPRGLGPKAYGDFNYLTNFFSHLTSFLDMGTSIGFYTKLSQRRHDFGLVSFYLSFTIIFSVLLVMFVVCIHVAGVYTTFLPDQELFYIYMAVGWAILVWFSQVLNKMSDAYGVTVSTEIARIIQKGLGLVIILALFLMKQLNLTNFFFYNLFIFIFLGVAFIWVIGRSGHSLLRSWWLTFNQIKLYSKEFYNYSHPLLVYALIGLIVGILDRWMLQKFSGSVEQGFYGLSYQIGAVCFLFTSAMTPLITREFSIAFGEKNLPEMSRLFRRYIPMLYAITAYFACFIAVESHKVTVIIGGGQFQQAAVPVAIMAFYPIHQTYGQLSGSVFYATGQTALYRNIGVIFMLIGLPVTYFLIAPQNMMGLNAAATGLAIKMVAIQFVGKNIQLWFNARLLKLSFWRYFAHQIICVASLLLLAILSKLLVDGLGLKGNILISFFISGLLYSFLVVVMIFFAPVIFGLQKKDITKVIASGRRIISHRI